MKLKTARGRIGEARAAGRRRGLKPQSVVILDGGAQVCAFEWEDGASKARFEIASGKANGALALVPVPGGVLIEAATGVLPSAIGFTGHTSDDDEVAAVEAVEAVGPKALTE